MKLILGRKHTRTHANWKRLSKTINKTLSCYLHTKNGVQKKLQKFHLNSVVWIIFIIYFQIFFLFCFLFTTTGIIQSNYSLVLQNVRRHMSGDYKCEATNQHGTRTSNSIILNIRFAPYCKFKSTYVYFV